MQRFIFIVLSISILLTLSWISAESQPVAEFNAPDTICINDPVTINNLTTGGNTYYWNFCTGNANYDPTGTNIGNPGGILSIPTYITMVKQANECFSFISCQGLGVVRYYHGSSFKNDPVNTQNLGRFGLISFNQEGIQIVNDNGKWVGFVCSDDRLIRLDFGTSLWNTPTASVVANIPLQSMLHGLAIVWDGTNWIGFATCSVGNNLVRFNFGSSLMNNPVFTDLGNKGIFNGPGAICLINEDNAWYAVVIAGHNTLASLDFGSSLLNDPAVRDFGNPGGFNFAVGLTTVRDCGVTTGYWVNYQTLGELGKLVFGGGGVTGNITGQLLGNIGQLSKPHSFSELFRQNDTLFAYITNRETSTLTRLTFLPCNNSSITSSILYNPPAFTYDIPGTYNIRLIVNEGMPDQKSICKSITVINKPAVKSIDTTICYGDSLFAEGIWQHTPGILYDTISLFNSCDSVIITTLKVKPEIAVDLGKDTILCGTAIIVLKTGVSGANYLWQDGSTDSTYLVTSSGHYWVEVTKNGCTVRDTKDITDCASVIWFPNVFTPNQDGINDYFHPKGMGVYTFNMEIFNRWGERVFETNDINVGWDGRFLGAEASDGVYVYIATFEMKYSPGQIQSAHGSITLLR